jgi:heavy metal sensor kinase
MRRLPIRLRLTLGFAVAMAALFAVIATGLYVSMSSALLDGVDIGLRSRAQTLQAIVPSRLALASPDQTIVETKEAFAQAFDARGRLLASSSGHPAAFLRPEIVRGVTRPTFFERSLAGVENVARLLAVPAKGRTGNVVIVVGSSLSDRADALRQLFAFLGLGGPVALFGASLAGWLLAAAALRPVDRMRSQASAISASGLDRRLTVPAPDDEVRRLAETLNEMLSRLDESLQKERRFLDDASHELRTPLTALKAELDVARSRPRTAEELTRALDSASEEADRLARMAEDLLVLSRVHGGRLPLHREETSLPELLDSSARLFRARADAGGVAIGATAPEVSAFVDGVRVRQALDNLLDNALRFTPRGGAIALLGRLSDGVCEIVVEDGGPGFPAGFASAAIEPFQRAPAAGGDPAHDGAGLGLAIVRAVAESHGGGVTLENRPEGGARVILSLGANGSG